MQTSTIKIYLIATILALSVSSLAASYLLIDEMLESSLRVGVNENTSEILKQYQNDLKTLRSLAPENEEQYKSQFFKIQDAMVIFEDPKGVVSVIKASYIQYFLIVFITLLLLSVCSALYLNRQVARSYQALLNSNMAKVKRLQELEYFDNWQHTAASLAHEIKNPLTPIEMMISNLEVAYDQSDSAQFERKLMLTKNVVLEEVARLKNMVNHFHRFSQLPAPEPREIEFISYLKQFVVDYQTSWPNLKIAIECQADKNGSSLKNPTTVQLMLDPLLFKQCLLNLFQNAREANLEAEELDVRLICKRVNDRLVFNFVNSGVHLADEQYERIFHIGYSSKTGTKRSGLGLSIVKKIVLDHQGDIAAVKSNSGVNIKIELPISGAEHSEAKNNEQV